MPPLDPCGYGVDVARSAHRGSMKFWRDSAARVEIRWYRVPADTPALPVPTVFTNPVWLPDKVGGDVPDGAAGEDLRPSVYDKGRLAAFFRRPIRYCGQGRQWEDGSDTATDSPLAVLPFGTSVCCLGGVAAAFADGGGAGGGTALFGGFLPVGGGAGGGSGAV